MPSVSVPLRGARGWEVLLKQRKEFWTPEKLKLTPHFKASEFFCHDGTPCPTASRQGLIQLCQDFLEPMRRKFGTSYVLSGYRHTLYNASIHGAKNSQHIYEHSFESVAADMRFATGNPTSWAIEAKRLRVVNNGGDGGVGRYPRSGFVHIDNRGYQADWSG